MKMKKKIISLLAIIMLLVGNATAQVFYLEDETTDRSGTLDPSGMIVPDLGSTNDQYTPLGGSTAILIGFGAAYLLAKKRKK